MQARVHAGTRAAPTPRPGPGRLPVMTRAARKLLEDVLALSEEERAEIATEVLASLDGPPDAGWDEAWLAALEQRQKAASGRRESAPEWAAVRARVLGRLGSR